MKSIDSLAVAGSSSALKQMKEEENKGTLNSDSDTEPMTMNPNPTSKLNPSAKKASPISYRKLLRESPSSKQNRLRQK